MKLKKLILVWSLILFSLYSCAKKNQRIIKIGYCPVAYALPFFVAIDKGYFKEMELQIEPIKFMTTNPMAEALIAKQIDGMTTASLSVCFSIEVNAPGIQKIYLIQASTKDKAMDYIVVKKESNITSMNDLKGKRIGIFPGSTILTYAKTIFRNLGIDPVEDISLIQLAPQIQIEALSINQVDALFTLEPIGSTAIDKGVATPLLKGALSKIMDPLPGGAYILSNVFIEDFPSESNKIIKAMEKAIEYIRLNENEAQKILPKWAEITPELAEKIQVIQYWKLSEIDKTSVQKLADFLYKENEIPKKINTNEMYYIKND